MKQYIYPYNTLSAKDAAKVGGKNASLGEMISNLSHLGIQIPDGFALSVDAYYEFMEFDNLAQRVQDVLNTLDRQSLSNLSSVGARCRELVHSGNLPGPVIKAVKEYYSRLLEKGLSHSVAVRSSATAEDSPTASFAGQHESFLNVTGIDNVLKSIKHCYASLFNDRAIKYRIDNAFTDMQVGQSVGIQLMVRSDIGSAGVIFTIEPENGNKNIIYITGAWGLGESVVQGAVNTDEYYLFKGAIENNGECIVYRSLGSKEQMLVYGEGENNTVWRSTNSSLRDKFILSDEEVHLLGKWSLQIEKHYGTPMDIEWAKDGATNKIYIVQARPETVHANRRSIAITEYHMISHQSPLLIGKAVGRSIVTGNVSIVRSLADSAKVKPGDIIVADITNPDWNALLKKAVCIVTNKGGRTSHASIVARELGIPAVVGTMSATEKLTDGQQITVSCTGGDEGYVYTGRMQWQEKKLELHSIPHTRTHPMFILADPLKALHYASYPNEGVGLLRMEFMISNTIQVHPMALVKYDDLPDDPEKKQIDALTRHYIDKRQFFVEKLAESIGLVAAAFYPKDVIVRMSDFKTNEYMKLLGGRYFEPEEENPMLGFRGASRYYHERYREGFGLECAAVKKVREEMLLSNVKVMIPFCRTIAEAQQVLQTMATFGLKRKQNGLEVYVMAELPSNILLATEFAQLFDGFSIGSNDLTQLTLGIDRDSAIISSLFDENNAAVKMLIQKLVDVAHEKGLRVGLCGQAPSDDPTFASFLVSCGIDSVSFSPDAMIRGIQNIGEAEAKLNQLVEVP
ncbi:phosphoenolpyruvate synthase [Ohtaekwangia koreensis]|uniref:Phosphoenolpyruvate synthase n=1 Tax=Ohtaekwangia koreensis TaxID=688867 RepID=A0A1T5M5E1_9BACT|nr:phosphoenolpyruvate synthase [Ohtaekwangia koreensis]SKC83446.1 phosphoenolpyruvate synthase [Ohtaekwangia koreensis]